MATRGGFNAGPQGPPGLSTGPAGGDLGGTYPDPTLQPTPNVEGIIEANRLDQMAAPISSVNMNSQKLVGVAHGTVSGDAATFDQIPTSLPPSGTASGDLAGTYPGPTLANTSNVQTVVRTNTLDQMAPAQANVTINNHKITDLANGTASADAVNFGQLPTTLPPNGPAGNDLSGTYPNPTVARVNGVSASGTPAYGQSFVANTGSAAAWQMQPGFAPSTGIAYGALMSMSAPSSPTFNLSAGIGYIVDWTTVPSNPTITKVTIPAQTVTISGAAALRQVNWWMMDASGTITSQGTRPTDAQRRASIQLGITGSTPPSGNIFSLQSLPVLLNQTHNQIYDLMYSLGPWSPSGNTISGNANLTFNKSAGTFFSPSFGYGAGTSTPNDPHVVTSPAESPASFLYSLQTTGSSSSTTTTLFDPTSYDVNGVKTLVGGGVNTSTIQRVWLFGSGIATDQLIVQYGQSTYPSLSAAVNAAGTGIRSATGSFIPNPDFVGIGTVVAYICTTRICTSLTDVNNCVIVTASKFPTP